MGVGLGIDVGADVGMGQQSQCVVASTNSCDPQKPRVPCANIQHNANAHNRHW